MDLRPVTEWLRGRSLRLDPVAALHLWNLVDDIARSRGTSRQDRSRTEDACYDKLVFTNIPWLVGEESFSPRWTKQQHRWLRQHLAEASARLNRAMSAEA